MPVMNGLEFLQALRSEPGGDTPKVIFCTTENDMDHIMMAMNAGANEYIMKPFDADIVQSKLEQLSLYNAAEA
jgi:two-component system chemotaxis response regulator CheY